jgi:DNA-directed RNA polymerase subunit L
MSTPLMFEMELRLIKSTVDIYEKYFKMAILREDFTLINGILNKIVVPNKALVSAATYEIQKLIIDHKIKFDVFINKLRLTFQKNLCTDISFSALSKLLDDDDDDVNIYHKYFVYLLLTNNEKYDWIPNDVNKQYPVENVFNNYKVLYRQIDEAFCSAVYYTNTGCLKNLISLIKEYNIPYKFQPDCHGPHSDTLIWIKNNILQGKDGSAMGWRSGPDSGRWPSTVLQDYEDTLIIITEFMICN